MYSIHVYQGKTNWWTPQPKDVTHAILPFLDYRAFGFGKYVILNYQLRKLSWSLAIRYFVLSGILQLSWSTEREWKKKLSRKHLVATIVNGTYPPLSKEPKRSEYERWLYFSMDPMKLTILYKDLSLIMYIHTYIHTYTLFNLWFTE